MSSSIYERVEFQGYDDINSFPDLKLMGKLFVLRNNGLDNNRDILDEVMQSVKKYSMSPFYKRVCEEFNLDFDCNLYDTLKEENADILRRLDERLQLILKDEGDLEERNAILDRAQYLCVIGDDMEIINKLLEETLGNKSCSVPIKFRIIFQMCRTAMFYYNKTEFKRVLDIANNFCDEKCDWETKNKYKLYLGLYALWDGNFKDACEHFLKILTTFNSNDLITFKSLGLYTIITSLMSLTRVELKEKVLRAPEIYESTFGDEHIRPLPRFLYDCIYDKFFDNLEYVKEFCYQDPFMYEYGGLVFRELKIVAYKQILKSFKSLKLEFLASALGHSVDHIDKELSHFISTEQISCRIDKYNGIVFNCVFDQEDVSFKQIMKKSDGLVTEMDLIIKHLLM